MSIKICQFSSKKIRYLMNCITYLFPPRYPLLLDFFSPASRLLSCTYIFLAMLRDFSHIQFRWNWLDFFLRQFSLSAVEASILFGSSYFTRQCNTSCFCKSHVFSSQYFSIRHVKWFIKDRWAQIWTTVSTRVWVRLCPLSIFRAALCLEPKLKPRGGSLNQI